MKKKKLIDMSNQPINLRAHRDAREYVRLAQLIGVMIRRSIEEVAKEFGERYQSEILHYKTTGNEKNVSTCCIHLVRE